MGLRSYTFTYDGLSRLKTAAYSGQGSESYGIPNINYDRNGNITQLQRNGKTGGSFGLMDNLTYTYTGNRLTSVNDAVSGNYEVDFVKRGSGGYTYQVNGALKTDENEEITNIVYNTYLNLPEEITLTGGRWIRYTYDGEGKLLKTEYSTGEYWEFVDEFVFKNGQPYQVAIPDGRATYASGNWVKEFDYKDHLGNTRVSFKEGATGAELTARTDFDPWGVRLNGTGVVNSFQNRWEMQGHEKEMTFNLNRVDFGARVYNPTIGRFDKPDRYSEKYMPLSTYQYSANNPIRYIDINGDSIAVFIDQTYSYMLDDGKSEVTGYHQNSRKSSSGELEYYGGQSFSFNDWADDREAVMSGDLKLRFVSHQEIYDYIHESGVLQNRENPWVYIERESRPKGNGGALSGEKSSGRMDYQNYTQRNYNSLNVVDGIAYNNPDYGNFLWGQGGKLLGLSLRTLRAGAHINNALNSKKDNPDKPYHILDSKGDQRAIKYGYNYLLRRPKGQAR